MATPPLPPRPYGAHQEAQSSSYSYNLRGRQPSLPPPVPPLPSQYRPSVEDTYNANQPLAPHLVEPLVAPRPQKVLSDVPSNMARRLDDQLASPPIGFPQPSPTPTPYLQSPPLPDTYMNHPGGFISPRPPQQGNWANSPRPIPPQARSPQPGAFPTPPLEQTQSFGTYGLGIPMANMSLN